MFILWLVAIGLLIAVFARTEQQSRRIWELEQKLQRLGAQPQKADPLPDGAEAAQVADEQPEETPPPFAQEAIDVQSAAEPADQPSDAVQAPSDQPAEDETGEQDGPWTAAARTGNEETETEAVDAAGEQPEAATAADLETTLGTRWTVWIGGLALALGGVFLVRYTIEIGVFGPGVRVAMAAVFGLALVAAGEIMRRTGYRMPVEGVQSAYVPAILTAAGAFTLFGAAYAAHAIYGFIGTATAFVLLGAIGLATILASLVHGVALAGLGLLGSYATPVLVASNAPRPWALFGFLAVILVAAGAIARLRKWASLMAAAFVGTGMWWLLYLFNIENPDLAAIAFIVAVTLAVLAVIWMKSARPEGDDLLVEQGICAIPAVFVALTAVNLAVDFSHYMQNGHTYAAAMIIALVLLAAFRSWVVSVLIAALAAVILIYGNALAQIDFDIALWNQHFSMGREGGWTRGGLPPSLFWGLTVGVVFLACGFWRAREHIASGRGFSAVWLTGAAIVPFLVLFLNWVAFGNLNTDIGHAFSALCLAVLFAVGAEWLARSEEPPSTGGLSVTIALSVAAGFLAFGITIGFGPGGTTILIASAALLPAFATRLRPYPVLGWLSVGFVALTLLRVIVDPTLVGWEFLQTTPVFNWLLPGYGIPAVAFAFAAWWMARSPDARPYHVLQAAAVLFALLAVAMQVRHAMNGGVLELGMPTLAEQSIYTLIAIGAGAILVALDTRSPSPIFATGSIALGVISVAFIGFMHFLVLNPLWTNESTGAMPVFNLLLLGFLMPAVAMAALAFYARDKRPDWYIAMQALVASALGFAYATLSLRRLFQGEFIAFTRATSQVETYSYSALWLVMGVALLIAGIRFESRSLRIASAILVVVSVAKVFLLDMSELEGVLRALSFIGLGIVLIGIGLFYQRMLTNARA